MKRPTTDLTSWPEGALRGCARHAERPDVRARAAAELIRRSHRPWLTGAEKIIALVNLVAVLGLVSIAFWLTGCSFVSEGTGAVGCKTCYRPPKPGPYPSHHPNDIGPSTDEGESSSSGDVPGSTSDDPGIDPGSTTADEQSEGTGSSSESSSTGESAEYEPAHCDMTCPAGDALQPSEAQAGGTFPGCYCATPCESDDECGPLEHCEPFFGRCTVWCMGDADCLMLDSPPGSMACTLWWDGPDDFVHFCSYWNEDAP